MKKMVLLCAAVLACGGLAGCGNSSSHKATSSSRASSSKVVKHHKKNSSKKQSSSSSSVASQQAISQSTTQQASSTPSNGQLPPSTDLHDFINRYGESPAAYLSDHYGMSPEQAVQSVPNDMKSSGEIQDTYQLQQGQDPFH
jgi:hypothetical protein